MGFFAALLIIALLFSWLIVAPFVGALVLAGVLAFLFRSVYRYLLRVLRFPFAAAACTVIAAIVIVFLPLAFFGMRIFGEATGLYASLSSTGGFDLGGAVNNFFQTHFSGSRLPYVVVDFNTLVRQGLAWFLQNIQPVFSGVAQALFTAFLSILGFFYFLKDGEKLKKWVLDLIPLELKYVNRIMREMGVVASSVVQGSLVVALIQGIAAGVGFILFHIPNPAFWASLVVLFSLIPFIGILIVAVPAVAYLLIVGQTASGIGLAIWSIITVNLIYNILGPHLMGRGNHIHPFVILLSVLGGIALFGPIGFLMGPLIVSFLFSLLKIYPDLVLERE
jgi:predicted PurR-regulated permease PerM